MPRTSTPLAVGSSVPQCPIAQPGNILLIQLPNAVDVIPGGLQALRKPNAAGTGPLVSASPFARGLLRARARARQGPVRRRARLRLGNDRRRPSALRSP